MTDHNNVVLDVSQQRNRVWVNNNLQCVARFSIVSGYEIYNPDGSMKAFLASTPTLDNWLDFANSVNDLYQGVITADVVTEFSDICGGEH